MDNNKGAKILLTCALVGAAIGTLARVLARPSTKRAVKNTLNQAKSNLKKAVKARIQTPKRSFRKPKRPLATIRHHPLSEHNRSHPAK